MGSVSQSELVRLTVMSLASISLQAFSIQAMRSPMLLPRAMYAVLLAGRSISADLPFCSLTGRGYFWKVRAGRRNEHEKKQFSALLRRAMGVTNTACLGARERYFSSTNGRSEDDEMALIFLPFFLLSAVNAPF